MKKENNNDEKIKDALNKKLDEIIEQSKAENDAFKKLLVGLEQISKNNSIEEIDKKESKQENKKKRKPGK